MDDPVQAEPETLQALVRDFQTAEPSRLVTIPRKLFGAPLRGDLLHRVVVWQLAGKRQGTHMTKHRGLVKGSTRKIVPQKGSGGARHGSIKAPIFVGGNRLFFFFPTDINPLDVDILLNE
jgi:large subunit ribosomal protein L4